VIFSRSPNDVAKADASFLPSIQRRRSRPCRRSFDWNSRSSFLALSSCSDRCLTFLLHIYRSEEVSPSERVTTSPRPSARPVFSSREFSRLFFSSRRVETRKRADLCPSFSSYSLDIMVRAHISSHHRITRALPYTFRRRSN